MIFDQNGQIRPKKVKKIPSRPDGFDSGNPAMLGGVSWPEKVLRSLDFKCKSTGRTIYFFIASALASEATRAVSAAAFAVSKAASAVALQADC